MNKIVYILSDNRSGSTLLDQLLGAHSGIVSLGEVHHLAAYARQDRGLYNPVHPLVCSCGQPIVSCPFWAAAATQLERPFDALQLHLRFLGRVGGSAGVRSVWGRPFRRMIRRFPQLILNPAVSTLFSTKKVGADSFALFDAITEAIGADCLVDSSKSAFRFRALYDFAPNRVFGILLVRDYRGAVHSKMKRGQDMGVAACEWVARIQQASRLTDGIPDNQLLRLRYEDLCNEPRSELARICELLELDFENAMLSRPSAEMHHLGGSPSKFDPARKSIQLDQSYADAFTKEDLARMREIVGVAAAEWGYE